MISLATLKIRLVWLGGKDVRARHCCVRECNAPLPWRVGGRRLEISKFDGHWRHVGALCHDCAVAVRTFQFHAVDKGFDKVKPLAFERRASQ